MKNTLKEILKSTYNHRWANEKGGLKAFKTCELVINYLGADKEITKVKQTDLDAFIAYCVNELGNSNSTINRKLSAYSVLQNYAYHRDLLSKKLVIEYRKESKQPPRYLTEEDEKALLDKLGAVSLEAKNFTEILIDTGLRPSELARINSEYICTDSAGDIYIRVEDTKNGVYREIYLTDRALRAFGTRRAELEGIKLDYQNYQYTWNKVRKAMGKENDKSFTPYICRHTFASRLVQKGAALFPTVKELMGHKNIEQTLSYAHLAPNNRKEAIRLLQ